MSESFNAVPPPSCLGHVGGIESQPNREETDLQPLEDSGEPVNRGRQEEKPANVSNDHWKQFQQLKLRRQHGSARSSKQRAKKMRQSALKAVKKAVSLKDVEEVLRHDGVDSSSKPIEGQPQHRKRSIKPQKPSAWQEVKQYIDPNPQLQKTADEQHRRPKSGLEKQLDHAVDEGRHDTAVDISDQLAQRELAQSVVTAIDCYKHVNRKREQASEVKSAKKSKLLWRFERKERWETKGNM